MKSINYTPYTDPIGYQLLEYHLGVSNNLGVPENGWIVMENPFKMDDWGGTLFLETPIFIYAP